MQTFHAKARACVAGLALLLVASLAQANAVVNGGFESGDFTGWVQTGDTDFTGVDAFAARSGDFGAVFGNPTAGSLMQEIVTLPGQTYRVSFWLNLQDSATPNSFSWSWDGVMQAFELDDATAFEFTEVSALVTASGALTALQFNFVNEQSFWLLDDVAAVLPEPASLALAGAALALLAGRRRRRTLLG